MTTDEVGKEYLKEANLMFIASMLMALAVEHSNLHQRLALNIISAMGTSPRRLRKTLIVLKFASIEPHLSLP
jgi:sodium-dependent dicarboxylate transporter 2/3/5